MCAKKNDASDAPVEVMSLHALDPSASLSHRAEVLTKNRFQVIMHNMDWIREQRQISQFYMCETDLEGTPKSSQMSAFRKGTLYIPFQTLVHMAVGYGYTPEQLMGQLLDAPEEDSAVPARPETEYAKYEGHYAIAYFNTDANLGENTRSMARAVSFGVLTLWHDPSGKQGQMQAVAFFNIGEPVCQQMMASLESCDRTAVRQIYEQAAQSTEAGSARQKTRCFYDGTLALSDRMAEITLCQVYGSDVAHLCLHNRAANSSDGSSYKGGLATMLSTSRGMEHMPCVQAAVLSRRGFSHVAREELAQHLMLQLPHVDLRAETKDIMTYVKALFPAEESESPLCQLSEEDKAYLLERYMEKKLTDAIRRNVVGYYKVSTEMDSAVYKALCR